MSKQLITAKSIHEAHFQALLKDIQVMSTATLLAGEVSVVTIESIEGIVDELKDFISESGISKNNRYIFNGLLSAFLLKKAKEDGVIFITATQKQIHEND